MISLKLGLSPEALEARRGYIGASDAKRIVEGDWHTLWAEKRGLVPPADLSDNFAVALGSHTEILNLAWYEKVTGHELSFLGRVCKCQRFPILTATLDGFDEADNAVIEAKHVNAHSKIDDVTQRYMPQVHHQMLCAGVAKAALSVIIGTNAPLLVPVELDELYAYEYVDRAKAFWQHVVDGTEPSEGKPLPPPELVKATRKVSMEDSNAWGNAADIWLNCRSAAQRYETAAKELKALVEPDVSEASGHGIRAVRNRAGALTIKEI